MWGLGRSKKRRPIKDLVNRNRVEVVLIQESKLEVVDRRIIREISGFARTGWAFLPSVGASGGVIIFWDKDRILEVASRVDNFSVTLTAFRVG